MEAIPKLIFNLLAQRKSVILPHWGTLAVEQSRTDIDGSGKLTLPRTRVLFSTEEKNGELLTEIISAHSGIALKSVKPQYKQWLSGVKKASETGDLIIEGVCVLHPQPGGEYRVEISKELDAILNPFESDSIQLTPLKIPEPPVPPKPETAAPPTPPPPAPEKEIPGKNRRTGWFIAAGVLLLTGIFAGVYVYNQGNSSSLPPVEHKPGVTETPPQAKPEVPAVLPDTLPADSLKTTGVKTPQDALPQDHSGEAYHVIAGVFSNRENAERFVELNSFDPAYTTLIPTTGDRFMVSIGKYATKEEADREMNRWRSKIPEAWVSKRKK